MRLTTAPGPPRVRLDADQESVVRLVEADHRRPVLVLGAPGSGKTTTAIAAFVAALQHAAEAPPLFIAPTRRAAARVRELISAQLLRTPQPASGTPRIMVQTVASVAYSVLRARATALGQPAPTLITGAEQDAVLADLLAGHEAGLGEDPHWPANIDRPVRQQPAFRAELRDLLTRAVELGLGPAELAQRGREFGRPEWEAAARVLAEYIAVTALGDVPATRGARYDVAAIVDVAIRALATWDTDIPGTLRPQWGRVIVDDYQDATLATARLLRRLVDDGSRLMLFADPDAAVQGFRGATPALVGAASTRERIGGFGAQELVLPTVWRGGEDLRGVVREVSTAISVVGGARHRKAAAAVATAEPPVPQKTAPAAAPEPPPGGAECVVVGSDAQEAAYVARRLREEHLHHGTPWSQMVVIARSTATVRHMQRALREAGVPTAHQGGQTLHTQPAVRPLLLAMEFSATGELSTEDAIELLCSPLAGMDAMSLRTLRRALQPADQADAPVAALQALTDELLVHLVTNPQAAAELPSAVRAEPQRLARVLAAGRDAAAAGGGAVDVLWAVWDASGLAPVWRRSALAGGALGDRADADLDAVMALFTAAEQFDERHPGGGAAPFVAEILAQDFAADTLAAAARREQTVAVRTPAGTDGEEWEVAAVVGVQDGAWPDLRVRDSLLGAGQLADIEAGRTHHGAPTDVTAARRAILDDELRMLLVAVSRARRRLIVTAVTNNDERPSGFFDMLATIIDPATELETSHPSLRLPPALDLRALVAELRAALEDPGHPHRETAAAVLAELAMRDIPGADPAQWQGLAPPSSTGPLHPGSGPVRVSPSNVEMIHTCPLRWALQAAGGEGAESQAQTVGTLIHAIAADHPTGTAAELQAALAERIGQLGLGEGWADRREAQRLTEMIDRLAKYLATVPGEVSTEVPVQARHGRAHLVGRIDRVEWLSDESGRRAARVVDLKTSASAVSQAEAAEHPQLASYQVAVEHGGVGEGVTSGGARLVYLGKDTKRTTTRNQPALEGEGLAQAEKLVADAAEIMAGADFVARKSQGCRNCPVRSSCPLQAEGRRITQ